MHREFRELLNNAEPTADSVIVLNVDIRRFSDFSSKVDSNQSGLFVTEFYKKLIDNYFNDATFFKSTGDGLLIIKKIDRTNADEQIINTIRICLNLINEFPSMFDGDRMLNFEKPKDIGIGIARGSACGLVAEDKVLDYSGDVLNLASRLNDVARPRGIVVDGSMALRYYPLNYRSNLNLK